MVLFVLFFYKKNPEGQCVHQFVTVSSSIIIQNTSIRLQNGLVKV